MPQQLAREEIMENSARDKNGRMRLTPKNTIAIIGAVAALVSFSRVCVLLLEALSTIQDERSQDAELLEVCKSGIARGSLKMRSACLAAQADRASPIVFKAILRAVSIAFDDFSQSVSSPGKLLVVVLFVICSIFLPVTSWIRAFISDYDEESASHVVVVANEASSRPRIGFRNRVAGALKMRRGRSSVLSRLGSSFDVECDAGDSLIDIDVDGSHAKWD